MRTCQRSIINQLDQLALDLILNNDEVLYNNLGAEIIRLSNVLYVLVNHSKEEQVRVIKEYLGVT